MKAFDVGLSALRAQQQTLAVLGNNLANAATPGYHRQRVELQTRPPIREGHYYVGAGVDVKQIVRLRNSAVETAMLRNTSETGTSQQALEINRQIESLLTPGDSSIHQTLSNFFNRLEKASNAPQDLTVRQEFLSSADELMNSFNSMDQKLAALERDVRLNLDDGLKDVNQLLNDIAGLNSLISKSLSSRGEPNDLLDRRDAMLTKLTEWVPAESFSLSNGREQVLVAGGAVVITDHPATLQSRRDVDGITRIRADDLMEPILPESGKLQAMTAALNETIPSFRGRLRDVAREIIRTVDQQHAQGMSDQGPYSVLLGTRGVLDVTSTLNNSMPDFPINSGDLYLTVTEDATGVRRTEKVSIDTTAESLTDIAAKLSALDGVVATIDTVRKTVMISAEGPYSIDFAGRPDNVPVLTGMTGTSRPEFSGWFEGNAPDEWSVTFSGPGTVGETVGLTATIRDSSGQIIGLQNIGAGYEAGAAVEVRDGVSLQFGSGTVAAADTFSLSVTDNPDETGILSALGINSLFASSEPGLLKVREELLRNPERLATSASGRPGDATNLAAIARLRDLRLDELSGRTFTEEIADITAESGLIVQAADSRTTQLENYQTRLQADQAALSGVDINQEMLEMMQSQRAYQAAARFISVADQMLAELFTIAR
jgi:flagellar hook-associated protein 1 FlgK